MGLGEFVGLWAWRNFRWVTAAAMLPLALALAGCEEEADTLQTSQSDNTKSAPQPEQSKAEKFITEGKPTKIIETPWGRREVYDPAQDPAIIAEFKPWFDSGFKAAAAPFLSEGSIIGDAKKTKGFDYLRHQCMSVTVSNQCAHFNYTFKANCEAEKNLHKLSLSECENRNLISLKTSHWGAPECRGEASLKNNGSFQLMLSFEESLEDYFRMTCDVWRGEDGDMYWQEEQIYPGEVPTRRFKQYRLKNEKTKQ